MLEEMKKEEIAYEKWEVTEGAKDLLHQIQSRGKKLLKRRKLKLN